jgi:ribosomal protein L23
MTRKGMQVGRTNLKKKAYVTLKQGQTIDIVSGEGNED